MELKWTTCLRAGVTLGVLWLLIHYWTLVTGLVGIALGAALPLILGFVIAYVINILMSFYEKKLFAGASGSGRKAARPVSMILAFISILLVVTIVIQMIVPELLRCLHLLLEEVPKALDSILAYLEQNQQLKVFFDQNPDLFPANEAAWRKTFIDALKLLGTGMGDAVSVAVGIVSTVFSTAVTLMVALVFSIYLLTGKERITSQVNRTVKRYLPARWYDTLCYVLKTLNHSFHSFIVGQCMEAVILGMLCIGGMLLLRIPYAAMIGSLVGFTALIPVAGAYIGAVVGAFMIFTVSPVRAIIFLVFLMILQQLEGNLIYPRVVGSSIGLPGVWVLAAVTIGGGVLGVGGMLLGVPIAAAIYQLIRNDVNGHPKA